MNNGNQTLNYNPVGIIYCLGTGTALHSDARAAAASAETYEGRVCTYNRPGPFLPALCKRV